MNIALWIAQGLLAAGFVFAGWMKAQPEKARKMWPWARAMPTGLVVFIGLAELAGAVGLIVPEATGLAPAWTPIAATALAVVVMLGGLLHLKRGEAKEIGVNVFFLALAVLVAIGRF